jgi:hypothetical protein
VANYKQDTSANLNSHVKVDVVVYGLGTISTREESRCQFAFVLLYECIGKIHVYDPILTRWEHVNLVYITHFDMKRKSNGAKSVTSIQEPGMEHEEPTNKESKPPASVKLTSTRKLWPCYLFCTTSGMHMALLPTT